MPSQAELMKLAITLGVCYVAFKYAGSQTIKAGAVAVGAVVLAKRIPYVQDALA